MYLMVYKQCWYHDQSKELAKRAAAWCTNLQAALKFHWNNRGYGAGKHRFSTC